MHLLLLGHDTLAGPLRQLGHEVTLCGPGPGAQVVISDPDPDWDLIERLVGQRGSKPDGVLLTDDVGFRRLVGNIWQAPVPTAFYGIDSPLNRFWQRPYARLFDLAFLDQPVEASCLAQLHPEAHWLPVGIDPSLYQGARPAESRGGVCFVGVVDPGLRPKRTQVLARVARLSRLTVRGGRRDRWFPTQQAAELYRSYEVVLNENLFAGLTTRPLEAMAAGGCLLSEAAPGAMDVFFKHCQHLAYYGPQDLEQVLGQLLGNHTLQRRLSWAGREAVLAGHTLAHRAARIVEHLERVAGLPSEQWPRARGGEALRLEGLAMLMAGLRWPGMGGPRRVLRGAARLRAAAADGADPLLAARQAGYASLALGRAEEALGYLRRSAEAGKAADRLDLALGAWQAGQGQEARLALQALWGLYPGLEAGPGQARFHQAAAGLLRAEGRLLRPGFAGRGLPPALWTALEHLQEAVRLDQGLAGPWEMMGDILMDSGAATEAHACYRQAFELAGLAGLARKIQRAAQEGYLL